MQHIQKPVETLINKSKSRDYKITNTDRSQISQTILRHHSVRGLIIIRCYLKELEIIKYFSSEHHRLFFMKRQQKETKKLNRIEVSKICCEKNGQIHQSKYITSEENGVRINKSNWEFLLVTSSDMVTKKKAKKEWGLKKNF